MKVSRNLNWTDLSSVSLMFGSLRFAIESADNGQPLHSSWGEVRVLCLRILAPSTPFISVTADTISRKRPHHWQVQSAWLSSATLFIVYRRRIVHQSCQPVAVWPSRAPYATGWRHVRARLVESRWTWHARDADALSKQPEAFYRVPSWTAGSWRLGVQSNPWDFLS